jgi:DNA-directed RNA polymerase subunit RPC12/RpoP
VAIKYYCPKCHKRFVEWGAKKSGFKCPNADCGHEELKLMDSAVLIEAVEKPKLKRVKRKKTPPVPLGEDFDVDEGMVVMPLEDEDFEDVESEEEEAETEEVEEVEEVIDGVDEFAVVEDIVGVEDVDVDDSIGEDIEEFDGDEMPLEEEII